MSTENPFVKVRRNHDLSQAKLGEALCVGQSAICNYETGVRLPELDVAWRFIRFAESLGEKVSLEEIYPEPSHEAAA